MNVNGRIDPPGDRDIFRFTARAGGRIVAEVYARRLDSPLDSVLKLTDAQGLQLASTTITKTRERDCTRISPILC